MDLHTEYCTTVIGVGGELSGTPLADQTDEWAEPGTSMAKGLQGKGTFHLGR